MNHTFLLRAAGTAAAVVALFGCEQPSAPVPNAKASATSSASVAATTATTMPAQPPATVPVPAGSRVEDKVNAVFHYYEEEDLDALADAEKKLLEGAGFTIDKEKKAVGYRTFEVSKGNITAKVNVACVPAQKQCFVSLPKR